MTLFIEPLMGIENEEDENWKPSIPGDVIDKQRTSSASVVGACNGSKRFLAGLYLVCT